MLRRQSWIFYSRRLWVIVAGVSLIPAANAEIYKWVDANGVVNYSEAPPSKRPSQVITPERSRVTVYHPEPLRVESPSDASRLKERVEELERQLARERQERDYAAQLAADDESQRLEQCRLDRRVDCYDEALGVPYPTVVLFPRRPLHFDRPAPGHAKPGLKLRPREGRSRRAPRALPMEAER
jgi:Domain of unknown function (DUF4124)